MKAQVAKILSSGIHPKVLCQTNYGSISVIWMGENPLVNQIYNIELDSNEILVWGKDVNVSEEKSLALCDDHDSIKIVGDLESVDKDGYMVLRLDNNIIAFATRGVLFEAGLKLRAKVNTMEAYPVDY